MSDFDYKSLNESLKLGALRLESVMLDRINGEMSEIKILDTSEMTQLDEGSKIGMPYDQAIKDAYKIGLEDGRDQERDRIMALVEKLAQPTSDKATMTIDRTELLKAILAK